MTLAKAAMVSGLNTFVDAPPPGWNELVSSLGGTVYHSSTWADYQRATQDVQPIFALKRDSHGGVTGGSLLLFRRSRRPVASLFFRDLTIPAYPFINNLNGSELSQLLNQCETVGRTLGCSEIRLESFMSGRSDFIPAHFGYKEIRRIEFCVDLTRDLDGLWKAMRKDHRERVKRLKREGVFVEVGNSREDLRGLKDAREFTQARRSQRGQGYEISQEEKFYEQLDQLIVKRGAGRLFVARRGSEIVASIFFLTFNGRANSVFSGSTDLGYKVGAQSGLFWSAVEHFKSEGFHELNRGGLPASAENESDPLHGIYLFKLRLGTTPQICRSGVKVLSPLRQRLRRLRRSLWR